MNTLDYAREDSLARYYDFCVSKKEWNGGELNEALNLIGYLHETSRITNMLEIGCGMGDIIPHLPESLHYTGLDPTKYSVEQARMKYTQYSFVMSRAETLPFSDSSFDLVYSFQTLQMVTDPKSVLNEVERVIKPGGYILFISPNLECPWGHLNSIRHYSYYKKLTLVFKRFKDLILRFVGISSFRVIPETYVEATGQFKKKDDDLKHLVSTWEIVRYLSGCGFKDIGTKTSSYKLFCFIPQLRYYRGGMYLFMQKRNTIKSQ